jgi:hypothetical protein
MDSYILYRFATWSFASASWLPEPPALGYFPGPAIFLTPGEKHFPERLIPVFFCHVLGLSSAVKIPKTRLRT